MVRKLEMERAVSVLFGLFWFSQKIEITVYDGTKLLSWTGFPIYLDKWSWLFGFPRNQFQILNYARVPLCLLGEKVVEENWKLVGPLCFVFFINLFVFLVNENESYTTIQVGHVI